MPLCECGCGQEVKPGNRFINGHNWKGVTKSPEHRNALSITHKGIPKSSEHCAALSIAHKGVSLSSEHCAAISVGLTGHPVSEETRDALSIAHKNSDKSKSASEKYRGGNDIVNHHYIYDHDNLALNTVRMSRSDHTSLHRLFQKLGYDVPHINVKN